MNCEEVKGLLQIYSDGELDVVRHVDVEKHLKECVVCARQESYLKSLRDAASSTSLYYKAPGTLLTRLQIGPAPIKKERRKFPTPFASTAAGLAMLIGTAALFGTLLFPHGGSADLQLAEQLVAGHIRSLQVEHAVDVASSDRHTVKPWFLGKLDYAPQVPDLSLQGYPLSGGRLDYQSDRPVAALVYYRRRHAINLFVWPTANDEKTAVRRITRQGFHIRHWQHSGMTYWVVSDLNDDELDEFVQLVQQHSSLTSP